MFAGVKIMITLKLLRGCWLKKCKEVEKSLLNKENPWVKKTAILFQQICWNNIADYWILKKSFRILAERNFGVGEHNLQLQIFTIKRYLFYFGYFLHEIVNSCGIWKSFSREVVTIWNEIPFFQWELSEHSLIFKIKHLLLSIFKRESSFLYIHEVIPKVKSHK